MKYIRPINEEAVSKSQQRLFGMALSVKRGETKKSDVDDNELWDKIKGMADGMTEEELEKYASTSHDGLPEEVDEENATLSNTVGIGPDQSLPTMGYNRKRRLSKEELHKIFIGQSNQHNGIVSFKDFLNKVKDKINEEDSSSKRLRDVITSMGLSKSQIDRIMYVVGEHDFLKEDDVKFALRSLGIAEDTISTILDEIRS